MDRDNRWERVEPAYQLLTQGHSDYQFDSAVAALHAAYARNESDEFVKPSAILQGGQVVKMAAGDGVLFMNFRADRARELSRAFIDPASLDSNAKPNQHCNHLSPSPNMLTTSSRPAPLVRVW